MLNWITTVEPRCNEVGKIRNLLRYIEISLNRNLALACEKKFRNILRVWKLTENDIYLGAK